MGNVQQWLANGLRRLHNWEPFFFSKSFIHVLNFSLAKFHFIGSVTLSCNKFPLHSNLLFVIYIWDYWDFLRSSAFSHPSSSQYIFFSGKIWLEEASVTVCKYFYAIPIKSILEHSKFRCDFFILKKNGSRTNICYPFHTLDDQKGVKWKESYINRMGR